MKATKLQDYNLTPNLLKQLEKMDRTKEIVVVEDSFSVRLQYASKIKNKVKQLAKCKEPIFFKSNCEMKQFLMNN